MLRRAKFLIVDDEAPNVRLLERLLELAKAGPVFSVTDPRKALDVLEAEKPDIVLLDLHMPQLDGFTLLSRIKAGLSPEDYLPVLVLTADITHETRQRALGSGAHDFLTKPLDPDEVLLRIGNLLETRFLHLELQRQKSELERLVRERTGQLEDTLACLRAAQEQLVKQERLRALGMMASGIAHDFNNALTMVMGYGELLAPYFQNDAPEREREYFGHLMAAAEDASHVVARLRDFYRPADHDELRVPVDANLAIQQAIALTAPRWRDRCQADGIQIEVVTRLQPVSAFLGHAPEFREVLTNLIFNAVDAMPEGGTLCFTTAEEEGRIRIAVSDTGRGMSEEEASRCLEPFYTTKGDQGTGLGLAAVYGFVQRYGGSIGIETSRGKGATFILKLPASTRPSAPPAPEVPSLQRSLRVLVVDDQELIRQLIAELLEAEGHVAQQVANADEALHRVALGGWDVLISDQTMPDMTGAQLARKARELGWKGTFILLTGFGDEMRALGGAPPGVDLILSKPLTANGLRKGLLDAENARSPGRTANVG